MTHLNDALRDAEDYFHAEIPLTRAMGLKVITAGAGGFAVEAPVSLNFNHLQTAFGGSINAVATLAGYGLLWLALRDEGAHVVIRKSTIRFFLPIRETISATCDQPPPNAIDEFRATLRLKGKARMELRVCVEESGKLAAEWEGTFVALRSPPGTADEGGIARELPSATATKRTGGE